MNAFMCVIAVDKLKAKTIEFTDVVDIGSRKKRGFKDSSKLFRLKQLN